MEFSKREIIFTSWTQMKNHLHILVIITLVYLSIVFILLHIFNLMTPDVTKNMLYKDMFQQLTQMNFSFQQIIFIIAALLFVMGLDLGIIQICLNINKEDKLNLSQLFGNFDMLITYTGATLLYIAAHILFSLPGLLILYIFILIEKNINTIFYILGILALILPLFYISLRLQFYGYFIVDERSSSFESINKSANISKGYIYQLFLLGLILSIIVQISLIPYLLGLIISLPFSKLANTYMYLKLRA